MGERYTRACKRKTTRGSPYWALCGARLRPGTLVDIELPDGLIIRRLTVNETLLGVPYVYAQLHGLHMRIAIDHVLMRRSSTPRKRKKAK